MARKTSGARRRTTKRSSKDATPSSPTQVMELKDVPAVTREQIARRAYEIWMENGCPAGRDQAHWYEAEAQLTLGLGR